MDTSRLLQLSAAISRSVQQIHDFLESRDEAYPSFNFEDADELPDGLSAAQDAIVDATSELQDLMLGPLNLIHMHGSHNNMVSLNAIRRFGIANKFAPEDEISYPSLAASCGLKESVLRSLLRHAMTMRVFREPRKDVVAHTAASKLLRQPQVDNFLATGCNEMWPAAFRTVDALSKWPGSEEPNHTGFSLSQNSERSLYEALNSDPERAFKFSDAMAVFTTGKGFAESHVIDGYDWGALGDGLVVDIGGSRGLMATALAKAFPALNVKVQDLASTIEPASSELLEELRERVTFMAHDMFLEQPVTADVYYFRWVFHNWSDKYCVLILKSLIPALKKGATVLINDTCMPEPGQIPHWKEKRLRMIDLDMLAILNAHERSADEWQQLFQLADSRFKFEGINQPEGSNLAFIQAQWGG